MTASGREALQVSTDGLGITTIAIDRPDRMNAIDLATMRALNEVLEEVTGDPATRVLVLTGTGGSFTTGADLQAAVEQRDADDAPTPEETMEAAEKAVRLVLEAPMPVVAAVAGPAAGVGVSLALAADLLFLADDAYLFFAFSGIGLMPDGAASVLLPAAVGRPAAMRILLRGDMVGAAEALQLGLAVETAPAATLPETANKAARRLARGARRALELTKKSVNAVALAELDAALARENEGQCELLRSDDFAEGVDALMSGRRPEFGATDS